MVADDLSISSLSALADVTATVTTVSTDLDTVYGLVKNLSTKLNNALSGSALGQFEPRFLCWLKTLSEVKEDMDDAASALSQLSTNALAAAATLSSTNYMTPPAGATF